LTDLEEEEGECDLGSSGVSDAEGGGGELT
jgi:hypothetical protein